MFQKWQREQKMNVKIMKIYIIRYITLKFSGFQDLQFCWPIFRSNTEIQGNLSKNIQHSSRWDLSVLRENWLKEQLMIHRTFLVD